MELLLLLTAFFASLTGSSGAQASAAQQVQGVAVMRAAQAAQAAVQPARHVVHAAVIPARASRPAAMRWPRVAAAPLRAVEQIFERRLE
ncbi:hypothetical protein TPR58_10225 [Sphingomonas sp. HF-S3]|uniref:Uncharacterized protein n=1 Tax=Sphingomonas rustica TaxID=3103142 RepID=A0ABV0B7H3_9SPHN